MGSEIYAFVQFVDDKIKYVTTINNIKKFCVDTFNVNKKYKVLYKDEIYYKAHVICIGASKEEVETKALETRLRHKPRRFVEDSFEDTSSNEEMVIDRTKKVVMKAQKSNLDSAICNYETIVGALGNHPKNESVELKMEVESLKKQLEKMKKENDQLRQLNIKLQEDVINKFKDFTMMDMEKQPASKNDVPIGGIVNDEVHLGRGVFLPRQIYDSAMLHPPKKDSLFIKEIAVAVFGTKNLMECSITGMACNKTGTAAKPPLNPTKLMAITDILTHRLQQRNEPNESIIHICSTVKAKIREKMNDLTKPPRKIKNIESPAVPDETTVTNNSHD